MVSEELQRLGVERSGNEGLMQAIILCGGKGIRAYPFTEHFPKVMMPIGGTPMLVHLMRIYAAQGFREFILAAGDGLGILSDYFEKRFEDWDVRIVDTGEEADTGDRILRCNSSLRDPFFATYGDGLGNVNARHAPGEAGKVHMDAITPIGTIQADDETPRPVEIRVH